MTFVYALLEQHLDWQTQILEKRLHYKKNKRLVEKDLEALLKKRQLILDHELNLIKSQNQSELALLQIRHKQDIKDYRDYLKALDQLKNRIREHYQQLPEAMIFTIHHHAKNLLNKMWETDDLHEKIINEQLFVSFMTTLHNDLNELPKNDERNEYPADTLKLISASNNPQETDNIR
ncbi:hypothetical protein GO003_002555 [Methylicorpusculum oleiharenae]|uniref:hypothetical protein n=1 Tax=Methylicorpusculum oleiharenae TaxID=1338687 RepID=UPI00135750E7|nr:hypothetical protein [Methylicorpusculum oleiharenae]MCD2449269.1 hypothetical protein [Methylicorpusculum oleiharenae]